MESLIEASNEFQFAPLREGRLFSPALFYLFLQVFQFAPLREGRLESMKKQRPGIEFQFAPLREGRHISVQHPIFQLSISIRAPA